MSSVRQMLVKRSNVHFPVIIHDVRNPGCRQDVEREILPLTARHFGVAIDPAGAHTARDVRNESPVWLNKVAYYVRGKKAGEQRLVAKGSIGIGGHMNEADESLFAMDEQAYRAGVEREVNEEIKIDAPFEDRIVALLNDDSTEVGRVHLGIVHVFKLAEPKVEKREAMITGLTFLLKEELLSRRETMETWSQICLDSLERLLL